VRYAGKVDDPTKATGVYGTSKVENLGAAGLTAGAAAYGR
jgi:hypothetical protein